MPSYGTTPGNTALVGTSNFNGVRQATSVLTRPLVSPQPATLLVNPNLPPDPSTAPPLAVAYWGLLMTTPVTAPPGIVYSDNFNRPDTTRPFLGGEGLGPAWNAQDWMIVSNQAMRDPSATYDWATFLTDLGTTDVWCEADVTPNSGYAVINVCRPTSNASSGYLGFWNPGGYYEIGTGDGGGGYATLAASAPETPSFPVKLRLEMEGPQASVALRLYANGVLKLSTTSGIRFLTSYVGLNAGAGGIGPRFDNFRCGPLPYTP